MNAASRTGFDGDGFHWRSLWVPLHRRGFGFHEFILSLQPFR
jgi:hypothetical protein